MGYFEGLTASSFKTDENGQVIFYPWGKIGKGYDLPPLFVPPLKLEFRLIQTVETVCIGSTVSGAGGKYPRALCGRNVLYSLRHLSINTFASNNVSNISQFRSSSRNLPLKLSL